jgi:hypothetical protein
VSKASVSLLSLAAAFFAAACLPGNHLSGLAALGVARDEARQLILVVISSSGFSNGQ